MRAERFVLGSSWGAALGIASVLVPKCPLCLAAYLCLFGVSAGSAQAIVQLGAPLCLGLIFASALGTALLVARRSRDRTRSRSAIDSVLAARGASCCRAE